MSATAEDALTAALLWLKEGSSSDRLTGVTFVRYADRTGFGWALRFSREVKNCEVEDSRQDDEQRISMVVREWSKTMAKLREQTAREVAFEYARLVNAGRGALDISTAVYSNPSTS